MKKFIIWSGRICGIAAAVSFFVGAGWFWHLQKQRTDDTIAFGYYDGNQAPGLATEGFYEVAITEEAFNRLQNMESTEPVMEGYYSIEPSAGEDNWRMTLVNPWHALPESYSIHTVELVNGQSVDERCYPELQRMMDDCRAAGLSPYICSSFRTWEKQNRLFEENVRTLMAQGYSEEEARVETAKNIAIPGTSEHQLGLAVDIVDKNYQVLDEAQENTAVQKWLMENSWKYGFILRYPTDKSDITGIVYEPWHYRYVGKEAAEAIYNEGICLEEYLEKQKLNQ